MFRKLILDRGFAGTRSGNRPPGCLLVSLSPTLRQQYHGPWHLVVVFGPPIAHAAMSEIAFPKLAVFVARPIIYGYRTPSLSLDL